MHISYCYVIVTHSDLVDDWIGNVHDSSVFGSDYSGGAADHLSWPMLSIFLFLCAASFVTYRYLPA